MEAEHAPAEADMAAAAKQPSGGACNGGICGKAQPDCSPDMKACEQPPAAPAPSEEAEQKKTLGNEAFKAKNYPEAIEFYSEAIDLAGDAASGVYFSNRAVCRAALEDWQGAREDAGEALKKPGDHTKKALYQKARAELRLKLPEAAAETLRLAAERGLGPDVQRLLKAEGLTQPPKKQADPKAAEAKTAAAPATSSAPPAPQAAPQPAAAPTAPSGEGDAAAKAKEVGTAKYKEGAYREALSEYQRAVQLLPEGDVERKAQLLGNVAAACLMLRRAGDCASACEESLALDPSNPKVRARLATAQVATGDFAAARTSLGGAGSSGSDPVLAASLQQIAEVERALAEANAKLASGEPARALGLYAELEGKLFSSEALSLQMARCYLELKQYARVLSTTQQVLRVNRQSIEALVLRAEALHRNNQNEVASPQWSEPLEQGQRLLKEALSLDPDHQGARSTHKRFKLLLTKKAELKEAFDSREFEKGKEVLDAMIEQCQDNPIVAGSLYCERAKASVRLKDWRQVIKDVGQATYRNHELVQPYLYRAQAMQALERHEDAVKELESLFSWHRDQATHDKLQEAKFLLRKSKRTNYYELLGCPSVASQLEIKKAYRERASEWHPDKKGHLDDVQKKSAEDMFKRIGEAYEVLMDPTKKELYDKGYDLEGIEEQIQIKKQRTEGHGFCGMPPGFRPGGGCC